MLIHTDQFERDELLTEVVRRIVEVAEPQQLVLFGSAARGVAQAGSDFDILVIKAGIHRRHLAQRIYQALVGIGVAVDVIVATPEDIERYGDANGLIFEPVLREGKIIYERETLAA